MNTLPVMKPYIGGQWIDSESQKFTTIYDPSTGKPIAQVPQCTAAEVERPSQPPRPHTPHGRTPLCVTAPTL